MPFSVRIFVPVLSFLLAVFMLLFCALQFKFAHDLQQAQQQGLYYLKSFNQVQLSERRQAVSAYIKAVRPLSTELRLPAAAQGQLAGSGNFSGLAAAKAELSEGMEVRVKAQYRVLPDGVRQLRFVSRDADSPEQSVD